MTRVIQVDPEKPERQTIEEAAQVIRSGGLVAFPTETVYGLGADALNESAIERLFDVKGRPADNPLIVHVSNRKMVDRLSTTVSNSAEALIKRFWPGPLTLVLTRRPDVPPGVSAGLPTIAVRMPDNRVALDLIEASGTPVAAPSANLSGRPSPTSAAHVEQDLGGLVDLILDAGVTPIGIESTVLDVTATPPIILRPGWITRERISEVISPVGYVESKEQLSRSPGTRHRHYSPQARVVLVENSSAEFLRRLCRGYLDRGRVAFLGHTDLPIANPKFLAVILPARPADYARNFYSVMRELDAAEPSVIVVEGISEAGEGAAVMDRLRRSASEIIDGRDQ